MISLIFNLNCFKIVSLYSLSPGSRFNRTEIKNRVKLHNVPLDLALLGLRKSGVLVRERNYYSLNFENEYTQKILEICRKQYQQLRELPLNVFYLLVDLLEILSSLKGEVFLFGSYAKLIYKENSDVDLALIGFDRKVPLFRLSKLEKTYLKKIEVHYFEKKGFYKNKSDPLVRNILKDGMRLF